LKVLRVARWFIFKTKIPIWVNLEGLGIEKVSIFFGPFGIYYGHLAHFMAIW
jgi:hypothetical protein